MPLSSDQQAEIDQARGGAQPTLRPSVPALALQIFEPQAPPSPASLRTTATSPPSGRSTKSASEPPPFSTAG